MFTAIRLVLLWLAWTWATYAGAQWYQSQPTRSANYQSVLDEIEERMPAQHIYRDGDKITHTHETTHGLNSKLRNEQGRGGTGRVNCAYIVKTGGLFIMLPEPKNIKLADIARRVPRHLRDSTYQLYLVKQQGHWNNEPLYVLDEFSAYYNGSVYGIETGYGKGGRLQGSIANCLKFLYYSLILAELHPEIKDVVNTLGQHTHSVIVTTSVRDGHWTTEHNNLWEACRAKVKTLPVAKPLK